MYSHVDVAHSFQLHFRTISHLQHEYVSNDYRVGDGDDEICGKGMQETGVHLIYSFSLSSPQTTLYLVCTKPGQDLSRQRLMQARRAG